MILKIQDRNRFKLTRPKIWVNWLTWCKKLWLLSKICASSLKLNLNILFNDYTSHQKKARQCSICYYFGIVLLLLSYSSIIVLLLCYFVLHCQRRRQNSLYLPIDVGAAQACCCVFRRGFLSKAVVDDDIVMNSMIKVIITLNIIQLFVMVYRLDESPSLFLILCV